MGPRQILVIQKKKILTDFIFFFFFFLFISVCRNDLGCILGGRVTIAAYMIIVKWVLVGTCTISGYSMHTSKIQFFFPRQVLVTEFFFLTDFNFFFFFFLFPM